MEDPLVNCIEPHSLCMRRNICEYCSQTPTFHVTIQQVFVIIACADHRPWAVRDCNAHMHKNKYVKFKDAKTAGLAEFLAELKEQEGEFLIQRSNGAREMGWKLVDDWANYLVFSDDQKEWTVHLTNDTVHKYIPIRWFLDPEVLAAFSPDFCKHVNTAIDVLTKGVYLTDYEAQQKYCMQATEVEESAEVGLAVLPDGTVVRVLNPQNEVNP